MIIATNITHKQHDNVEAGIRPPLIDADGVMRIDNSSYEYFTTCARSSEYFMVERRQLRADRVALRAGGAWHIMMEILYRDFDGKPKDFAVFFAVIDEVLAPYFAKFPPPPEDYRTLSFLKDCLLSYMGWAEIFDDFEIASLRDGQKAIEVYFEFPLGEVDFNSAFGGKHFDKIQVLWCGRIDMIIMREGKVWILDHKTTTVLGANFFADFMNSSPMLGYTWAAKKLLGVDVAGLYLNACGIRKPTKTGISFEPQRQHFPYDPERLDEWQYNTLVLCSDFLSHLDRGYFPMETKWCVGKYGACPYLDVCTMPPSQRQIVLESNTYEDVTWNPKHGTRQ